LAIVALLAACGWCLGQTEAKPGGGCGPPAEDCLGADCRRGEPVIFGKPYVAPRLSLRVVGEEDGRPLPGIKLAVRYVWEWLEYPYPERPFGVWSEGSYSSPCVTGEDGSAAAAEFRVVPRGWYKGAHAAGRRPRFVRVDVTLVLPKCLTSRSYGRRELDRCRRRGDCELTLKVSCGDLAR